MINDSTWVRFIGGGQATVWVTDDVGLVFIPKNDLSLGQVPDEWLAAVLGKRCGCDSCGGSMKPCCRIATEDELKLWNS